MHREDRFVMSHRPYAVDLSSFRITDEYEGHAGTWYTGRIDAAWFRRRSGYRGSATVACIGELRNSQMPKPVDGVEFVTAYSDGRYGGDCVSRWDGENFWSASQDPDVTGPHLAMLRLMLAAFPEIPPGLDGWWTF